MTSLSMAQSECENFRYFLANNGSGGERTLFELTLDDEAESAEMEELMSFSYPFHIAYDANAQLLYIVRASNGSFRTLDVSVENGALSDETMLSESLGGAVATEIDDNGNFYIGSEADEAVYLVDTETGDLTFYMDAPIHGGDIAFRADGNSYLATRDFNGRVWEMDSMGEVMSVRSVPNVVTGLALLPSGEGFISVSGRTRLYKGNDQGDYLAFYNLTLDGEVFTTAAGDLASGCAEPQSGSDCENYVTYYTGYEQGGDNELYGISLNDDNSLSFTLIEGFSTSDNHIAVSASGMIYAVRGSKIDIFNPNTGSYVEQNIPIQDESGASLSGFPAATIDFNGQLYIGKGSNNTVYSVNIEDGVAIASVAFANAPVAGGDLVATGSAEDQILWILNRSSNTLNNLIDNSVIDLDLNEINGACLGEDGRLLIANGENSENGGIWALNLEDLSLEQLAADGGPEVFFNGDMASGCVSNEGMQNIFMNTPTQAFDVELTLAPNPATTSTFVDFSTVEGQRTTIEVLDMQGRVLDVLMAGNTDQTQGRLELNVASMERGIYFVRMVSGETITVERLMIAK